MPSWIEPVLNIAIMTAFAIAFSWTAVMMPSAVVRHIGQDWTPEKHRSMVIVAVFLLTVSLGMGYMGFGAAWAAVKTTWEL